MDGRVVAPLRKGQVLEPRGWVVMDETTKVLLDNAVHHLRLSVGLGVVRGA